MPNDERYTKKMVAKAFDIEAGKMVCLLHDNSAKEFGLFPLDRVEICNPANRKRITTVADLTDTMVKDTEVGLFEDVSRVLGLKGGEQVEVRPVGQPKSVEYIKKKLAGCKLNEGEMEAIVSDIASNTLSDVEASAFMAAVYMRGFDLDETVAMTQALIGHGKTLRLDKGPVLDKHSIGGTNGRATMIIVPIIASAGYYTAKTSSRSITSAAGSADAMEVLCNVSLSLEEIKRIAEKTGGVIAWGGAVDLAPADDKIIKIEHPLALDPRGQVIASVMAKKASVGAKYVVIDLPVGPEVKIKKRDNAEDMALKFIEVGKRLGIRVEAILTDGTEPSGAAFGPALEARHVLKILEGSVFDNLAQKSCELAGALFELVGKCKKGQGYDLAKEILVSGKALEKMKEIIREQKGSVLKSGDIGLAKYKKEIRSNSEGEISRMGVKKLTTIARLAGAPADKKAGVLLMVEPGDKVKTGQSLFEIHAENQRKLEIAENYAKRETVIEMERIILERFA